MASKVDEIIKLATDVRDGFTHRSEPFNPLAAGNQVFVRTVTHYYTGRVVQVSDKFVQLADGAWVVNTKRFQQAIENGELDEVEPITTTDFHVALASIVDVFPWRHDLPQIQK